MAWLRAAGAAALSLLTRSSAVGGASRYHQLRHQCLYDFATLIQAEVTTERKKYVAAGTLFGKQFLRLVRLGSYPLDAHMDGTAMH